MGNSPVFAITPTVREQDSREDWFWSVGVTGDIHSIDIDKYYLNIGKDRVAEFDADCVFRSMKEAETACTERNEELTRKRLAQRVVWVVTAVCVDSPANSFVMGVRNSPWEASMFIARNIKSAHFQLGNYTFLIEGWDLMSDLTVPVYQKVFDRSDIDEISRYGSGDSEEDQVRSTETDQKSDRSRTSRTRG